MGVIQNQVLGAGTAIAGAAVGIGAKVDQEQAKFTQASKEVNQALINQKQAREDIKEAEVDLNQSDERILASQTSEEAGKSTDDILAGRHDKAIDEMKDAYAGKTDAEYRAAVGAYKTEGAGKTAVTKANKRLEAARKAKENLDDEIEARRQLRFSIDEAKTRINNSQLDLYQASGVKSKSQDFLRNMGRL